jgi:hypothetical protein
MNISRFSSPFASAAKRRHLLLGLGSLSAGGVLSHLTLAHAQDDRDDDCPCGWQLVYEHDDVGTALSGSLSALVDAVRAGADVKVAYTRSAETGAVEWFRNCGAATIARLRDGETPVVSCLLTDIPDSDLDPSWGRHFIDPFALEWQAYNTTGRRHVVKFDAQTHGVQADDMDNLPLGWYIRR